MSLRKKSVSDGNGPAVSPGVTAHALLVLPGEVVVDVPESGSVGELPHPNASAALAAPITPMASRLPILLLLIRHFPLSGTIMQRPAAGLPR